MAVALILLGILAIYLATTGRANAAWNAIKG